MNPSKSNAETQARGPNRAVADRRAFLKRAAVAPVAVAAGVAADAPAATAAALPQIRLGKHSISRLICGDNPFKANSHLSAHLNRRMQRYYMTCVYERNRSREDLEKVLGQAPIPVGEVYLPNDPPRMFQAVQRAKRTCLAFKILAAGRFSGHRESIDRAFRQTFQSIKPGDAVIVGMYDEFGDEPAENADWVRRYGA